MHDGESDNRRSANSAVANATRIRVARAALQLTTSRAHGVAEQRSTTEPRLSQVSQPWKLSEAEQLRAALPVLVAARQQVVAGTPPLEAIAEAGRAGIVAEYARRALRLVVCDQNLLAWQSHPATVQSARTRALDKAIRVARRAFGKRGGWTVTRRSAP